MEQIRDIVTRATNAATRDERIEAYGRLVEQFRDMACGYAYAILGDFHLAEDMAQEAFILAFEKLAQLDRPEAFPGWFRRIVSTRCGHLTRQKGVPMVALDDAAGLPAEAVPPLAGMEQREMRDEVLKAIQQLPAEQREVTTLFYINGYSQNDIADFLEVPVGTVKNRLSASRSWLKERMMNMVEETLHKNAPDERFNKKVIEELLARPRPLEIPGHPVRRMFDTLRRALPDYEVVEGDEIVDRTGIINPWTLQFAFETGKDQVLRTETTATTFAAMVGRTPPVRLMTAGRQFRNDAEDSRHLKAHHGLDLVCIEAGANEGRMKATVQMLMQAVLGPVPLRYVSTTLPSLVPCYTVEAEHQGAWRGVVGCGVFKPEYLKKTGFNPSKVEGYAIGMVIENIVMMASGLDDIRKLWQPPYIP